MDKELPLARSKGTRSSGRASNKLLDGGVPGIPSCSSSTRNKRKKTTTNIKKAKGRKAKAPTTKGKVGAKVEVPDGDSSSRPRPKRHRHNDKDRKSDRGTKGVNRTPRRNASELGIVWIESYCPDGQPHRLVGIHSFDGGNLFKCSNCKKQVWLPTYIKDAAHLDSMIDRLGTTAGYCKFLDDFREAKVMVAKLQDLWYAKQKMENMEDFVKLVISVMEDKEYDRKDN